MYEALKQLEEINLFDDLVKCGAISEIIAKHKNIYEHYLIEKQKGYGTIQSVKHTSNKTRTPKSTVYKIIRRMKQ